MNRYFTRLERIERLYQRAIRNGKVFFMHDGTQIILSQAEEMKGYSDACNHIDSPQARIILAAVTDSNHGLMLRLLRSCLNPVSTSEEVTAI